MSKPKGITWALEQWQIDLIRRNLETKREVFAERFDVSIGTITRVRTGQITKSGHKVSRLIAKCHDDYMHHPFNG